MLNKRPPEGVCCWPLEGEVTRLQAQVHGPPGTVYAGGVFDLKVTIPDRYPIEPPKIQFTTPMYHPNIDSSGRICLDLLDGPPKGCWSPALNLCTVLAGVRQLLAEPNPRDPLMAEVTEEYLNNRGLFELKARQMVEQHAQHVRRTPAGGDADAAGTSASSETQPPAATRAAEAAEAPPGGAIEDGGHDGTAGADRRQAEDDAPDRKRARCTE